MNKRKTPGRATLARQATELAMAVPQVVAHRVGRMALAGAQPSARDRREFHRMGQEKVEAFAESWMAMAAQAWRLQFDFWLSALGLGWTPWLKRAGPGAVEQVLAAQRAATAILGSGLAPVRRRAVANAKRLNAPRR
jgi:hypothetical protein